MNHPNKTRTGEKTTSALFRRYLPLAISRTCISIDQPIVACLVARLIDPEVNLQVISGIIMGLAYLCECPVWNLFISSTALVKSKDDFRVLRNYTLKLCFFLALIYYGLLFGPLSDLILIGVIGSPPALAHAARAGLCIAGVWPVIVGYRRIQQGVFISTNNSGLVGASSIARLFALLVLSVLAIAIRNLLSEMMFGATAGVIVITLSVGIETSLTTFWFRKVFRELPDTRTTLSTSSITRYTAPLIGSALVGMMIAPIGAAMMFRMPAAELSLTVWPALSGLLLFLRTPAFALVELTTPLAERREDLAAVRKLTLWVAGMLTLGSAVFLVPAIGGFYFHTLSGLPPAETAFVLGVLPFGIFWAGLEAISCYLAGKAFGRRITYIAAQAAALFILLDIIGGVAGVQLQLMEGARWFLILLTINIAIEVLWFRTQLKRKESRIEGTEP